MGFVAVKVALEQGCFRVRRFSALIFIAQILRSHSSTISGVPRNFVRGGGVQQIQLRTEDRENGDLGAVAPLSGVLEATVIFYKKFHFI